MKVTLQILAVKTYVYSVAGFEDGERCSYSETRSFEV
jgi:hypothetical protein